jgi:hypothetical protein
MSVGLADRHHRLFQSINAEHFVVDLYVRLGDRQMRKNAGLEASLKMLKMFKVLMAVVITMAGAVQVGNVRGYANEPAAKTLYDLAKERGKDGKYVHPFDATGGISYSNAEELAKRSDAIIIGRPIRIRSYLSPDGASITTRCWMKVQEVLKGKVNRNSAFIVSVPGGAHVYKDKTIVAVRSRYYWPPQEGRIYALFLTKDANDSERWNVVGGSQGQFELVLSNDEVKPSDTKRGNPVRKKYRNMTARRFLRELHRVAR